MLFPVYFLPRQTTNSRLQKLRTVSAQNALCVQKLNFAVHFSRTAPPQPNVLARADGPCYYLGRALSAGRYQRARTQNIAALPFVAADTWPEAILLHLCTRYETHGVLMSWWESLLHIVDDIHGTASYRSSICAVPRLPRKRRKMDVIANCAPRDPPTPKKHKEMTATCMETLYNTRAPFCTWRSGVL